MSGNQIVSSQSVQGALIRGGLGQPIPRPALPNPDDELPSQRKTLLVTLGVATIAFGCFFGWAFTARLDAAAEAGGVIVSVSSHTPISNYEGGTISKILVKEGDLVTTGQVLVELDPTVARAQLGQYRSQYLVSLAQRDRETAEQQDKRSFEFSPELLAYAGNPMADDAMREQRHAFEARWKDYDAQVAVNRSHIEEARADMEANLGMEKGARGHLVHTEQALDVYQQLKRQGYTRLDQIYPLQTAQADLGGMITQYQQTAEKDRRTIQSYEAIIAQQYHDRQATFASDLQTLRASLAQLPDQIRGAEDVLKRKTIRAPIDGKVVNQKYFTVGGVVQQGNPIMDIVPVREDMVAEVQVAPQDLDAVRPGVPAEVQLFAYTQSRVPPIEGAVLVVGADKLIDTASGNPYILVRIRLSQEALDKWYRRAGVQLYPGMPVKANIVKGERRAIDYFLQPITDTFWAAFREK
jgi:HlyD family secretion protein